MYVDYQNLKCHGPGGGELGAPELRMSQKCI